MDLYRGVHPQWNMMPQYQLREANAFAMNKKIMQIAAEKNAVIEELNRAISIRNSVLEERNEAIKLRDEAFTVRDTAFKERDSAIAALRFHENSVNGIRGANKRGRKRMDQSTQYHVNLAQITNAIPLCVVELEDYKESKPNAKTVRPNTLVAKTPKKGKKVGEDLNRQVTTHGSKVEWESQDSGITEQINFDDTIMLAPVCTCTGVPRQCYKWGSGGWQSSCCTTSLSVFPLPQLPDKRQRMGGRKMSGSVFSRLLTRVAAEGHDLCIPLDLKNYWSKHGTNRYVTIK